MESSPRSRGRRPLLHVETYSYLSIRKCRFQQLKPNINDPNMKVANNKVVALTHELEVEGAIADKATDEMPLEYIHGNQMLLPKFEAELLGKDAGEDFSFAFPWKTGMASPMRNSASTSRRPPSKSTERSARTSCRSAGFFRCSTTQARWSREDPRVEGRCGPHGLQPSDGREDALFQSARSSPSGMPPRKNFRKGFTENSFRKSPVTRGVAVPAGGTRRGRLLSRRKSRRRRLLLQAGRVSITP